MSHSNNFEFLHLLLVATYWINETPLIHEKWECSRRQACSLACFVSSRVCVQVSSWDGRVWPGVQCVSVCRERQVCMLACFVFSRSNLACTARHCLWLAFSMIVHFCADQTAAALFWQQGSPSQTRGCSSRTRRWRVGRLGSCNSPNPRAAIWHFARQPSQTLHTIIGTNATHNVVKYKDIAYNVSCMWC